MSKRSRYPKMMLFLVLVTAVGLACNLPVGDEQESGGTAVQASVDVDGGEIEGPEGLRLVVPAGALDGRTLIQASQAEPHPAPQPGFESGSDAYQVELPAGTELRLPVEVVIPLKANRPDLEYGVFRWDTGDWDYLGGEMAEDGLHVFVDHFSTVEAFGSVNIHTRPVMFVNYAGDPAWILAWEWDTSESGRLGMPAAFVMRRGLFGNEATWWFQSYPMGTIYTWCVQWEEWEDPYWDLHGGGFVSKYKDTYNFILNYPITISPETPQGGYMEMERVEFSTDGGTQGPCGVPPGQIPVTATPVGSVPSETPLLISDTPEPATTTAVSATQTPVLSTATPELPTATWTPDLGGLTPQEYANRGTNWFDASCTYSDGDSDTSTHQATFEFSENGVTFVDLEEGESVFYTKVGPNVYENNGEDLYSRITFTDDGFDYFGEGYGLTGNCVVIRK